jgi:mono/diheme cytochrome c family protein
MNTKRLLFPASLVAAVCAMVSAHGAEATAEQGRALFAKHCAACHGERGFATTRLEKRLGKEQAMLERRTDLNPALINHVVRYGIGSMPWFTRVELPDADANAIASYLSSTAK